ncbi:MAG: 4Fe-4S dicluster domain-containing protein [Peptococcaceae bacterium]
MRNYLIAKNDFRVWLQGLQGTYKIMAPVKRDSDYFFGLWDGQTLPDNDYQNTLNPPKDLFFPQHEVLWKYQKVKKGLPVVEKAEPSPEKRILWGVRPCDAQSIKLLDKVFLDKDYQDPYYQARRLNTLIISLVCREPGQNCFCREPFVTEGSDLMLVEMDDQYLMQIITPAGEKALQGAPGQAGDFKIPDKILQLKINGREEIASADLTEKLDLKYDDPLWDEVQEKCLNCGICSFLCPTCHCFDLTDDRQSKKIRSWDSCMFAGFTKQGSGHNPRPSGKERLRQRIMHKFKYFPENYGAFACVGCGRCVEKCPVKLDIREILLKIKGVS